MQCQTLDESDFWPEQVQYGINRGHALSLFPQYRQAGERVTPAPIYAGESFANRIKRSLTKPVGALAERMRNR